MWKSLLRAIVGSDNFDEVELVHRLLRSQTPGTMIDVGAHHGSALAPFAKDGWLVHAFEPDPVNRRQLEEVAAALPGVTVDPRAVFSADGETLDLFTSDVSTGISTLTKFHDSHQPTATVETVRLDSYLEQASHPSVIFLKTDTEGHDLPVLQTFPWDSQRPLAIVCEFEDRKTVPLGYTYRDLGDFLSRLGYSVFLSEWFPIVEYGRRHTWNRFASYPTDVASNAWGNFIAVDPPLACSLQRIAALARAQLRLNRGLRRVTGTRLR